MDFWQDKVALIVGGSAGLGRAIAETVARCGAKVAIAARGRQNLDAAAEACRQLGVEVMARAADAARQDDVDQLVAAVIAQFGRLDLLVNAVGQSTRGEAITTTPEQFQQLWEANFLTAVRCTRAAADHLMASRGHVVNIGSLSAKSASPYLGAYPASKFPLAAYSQQLRMELADRGVHVLLVCPGPLRRDDAGRRYDRQAVDLPEQARRPGGGVKLRGIPPKTLAQQILRACRQRKPELIVPSRARVLFAVAQLWPSVGDWVVKKMTSSAGTTRS